MPYKDPAKAKEMSRLRKQHYRAGERVVSSIRACGCPTNARRWLCQHAAEALCTLVQKESRGKLESVELAWDTLQPDDGFFVMWLEPWSGRWQTAFNEFNWYEYRQCLQPDLKVSA